MLNRRHLRIKVLQVLYAYFQTEDKDARQVEKELWRSIDKMYELYIYFLLLYPELSDHAASKLAEKKEKLRPTEEDLNPNLKFVDNAIIQALKGNSSLTKVSEEKKVNWLGAVKQDLIRKMFLEIKDGVVYQEYMSTRETNFDEDQQFAVALLKEHIAQFGLLHDFFENESIYWLDDIDLICSMIIKNIKQVKKEKDFQLMRLFRDEEEEKNFIHQLVYKTIGNDEENTKLIDELTQNWELDRIAKMDFILLKLAITELVENKSIPVKVTLNEYIEIAKFYSTPKSQQFINGILDKAVILLQEQGRINKVGKGLMQ
ncbi:MAG: transcription antitermination factor NusB [Crocinitomicaceae bacterium]|nr:transcription antitermination factor NusB [Crocinitomicaceae bacterium]